MEKENVSLRIRKVRKSKKLTQKQVAHAIGCDRTLFCRYESGERRVPLQTMIKLARLFNTSVDYLAGLTDVDTPYPLH